MNIFMIKRLGIICFVLVATFFLYSCQNDDEYESPDKIIGEWFYDTSTDNQTQLGTIEFANDGKYKEVYVQVGLTTNDIITKEGTFSYHNSIEVVYTTKYDHRHILEKYIVKNNDNNTLELYNESTSYTRTLHRIIGTYTMQAGEVKSFIDSNNDANYYKYVSCDENVAKVDDDGTITAVKIGNTFIRKLSASGETVIRVNVDDPNGFIDIFEKYLHSPINQVIKDWGDNYVKEDGLYTYNTISYNVFDSNYRRLSFNYYSPRHVYIIEGQLQPDIDYDAFVASIDRKYDRHNDTDGYITYRIFKNDHYIDIELLRDWLDFEFKVKPNDYEKYDDLIECNVNNVPSYMRLDFSGQSGNLSQTIDNNDIYERIVVNYDVSTKVIKEVRLTCRSGVTKEQIIEWLEKNYYNNGSTWYPSKSVLKSNFYITLSTTYTKERKVVVNYNAK